MTRVRIFGIVIATLIAGCVTPSGPMIKGKPIDQIPMYGGLNRKEIPELKVADERFIAEVSEGFSGDLQKASSYWVDVGFEYYKKDDLENAMRRFNQAWLLSSENPEVYWGFCSILYDKREYCDAKKMADITLDKGFTKNGFLADAAVIYTGCALTKPNISNFEKNELFKHSDELFERSYQLDKNKGYVLVHWARALFARKEYGKAWDKIKEQRKVGGTSPPARFLQALSQKMPEP